MTMTQIAILASIQGVTELFPVSSSAHVLLAAKYLGIDPTAPEMTLLLTLLHTGTMLAVVVYFWERWKVLSWDFFKKAFWATAFTGVLGLCLKKIIESSGDELESTFRNWSRMGWALVLGGGFIFYAGWKKKKALAAAPLDLAACLGPNPEPVVLQVLNRSLNQGVSSTVHAGDERGDGEQQAVSSSQGDPVAAGVALWMGLAQGLCLPFRGLSRSGVTISVGLLRGLTPEAAEDFSFILAVFLTPAVLAHSGLRWLKWVQVQGLVTPFSEQLAPAFLGLILSFCTGYLSLRLLSRFLNQGRWHYFGVYCLALGSLLLLGLL